MQVKTFITAFLVLTSLSILGQKKIDTDSLLVKTLETISKQKDYPKAIQLSHIGIKAAPNYLDFHLALGRAHQYTQQIDSARYYYKQVIHKNPKYKEAFTYLIQLEMGQNNTFEALNTVNSALIAHPNDKELEFKKLDILYAEENEMETNDYLNGLLEKYPSDPKLKQLQLEQKLKNNSNRIGIHYSLTTFNRDGVGPCQLTSLQYIKERKKISWIAQLHYADRQSNGTSIANGIQYEFETYIKHTKKNYSYSDIAYSDDNVFPKWRLGYSFFQNLGKGWEGDLGMRYSQTVNRNVFSGVAGVGKYLGSYWINLKTYFPFIENKTYPSVTATTRYYFNTKYDYLSASIGYGTSPDERENLALFEQRFRFNSYRFSLGYRKLIGNHYIAGIQTGMNRQEYRVNNFQNEYNVAAVLQYKF